MDRNFSIKDLLYDELAKITEKKFLLDISKGQSAKSIKKIILNCFPKILLQPGNVDENVGVFAESLLHYLLTISLIPSQRKVSQNDIAIDIVIPDLKTLNSNPNDSIIIYFPKTNNNKIIKNGLLKLEKIQPKTKNIWVVLHSDLKIQNRTYRIENNNGSFNKILNDLTGFLSTQKQSKLKIISS